MFGWMRRWLRRKQEAVYLCPTCGRPLTCDDGKEKA